MVKKYHRVVLDAFHTLLPSAKFTGSMNTKELQ